MEKIRMLRDNSLTFEEGCNLYLNNCRERNLRQDTIRHYRQSYDQFYKFFDRNMPVKNITEKGVEKMFDKICLALIIIGALNWGLVGIFQFDLVAWLFGGSAAILSRILYTVIALAGIWCISLLFRRHPEI